MDSGSSDPANIWRSCIVFLVGLCDDVLIVGLSRLGCKLPLLETLSPIILTATVVYVFIQFCQHGLLAVLGWWHLWQRRPQLVIAPAKYSVHRTADEGHIRALLLQAVSTGKRMLRSLRSEDREDKPDCVMVEAELVTQERNDSFVEQMVSRMSLEPGVLSISWRIIEQEFG